MKKSFVESVVALAALAAAGPAAAQSTVTVFGIVDAAIAWGHGSIANRTQVIASGMNASRLGFRGREDLGGGLSANFWLEAGLANDSGMGLPTNSNNQASGAAGGGGLMFNRQAWTSLAGRWGELRLGRDYTPQLWNITLFDTFVNNGVGVTQTLGSIITGPTAIRASNSIGYLLPGGLGGVYGQAQLYLGENPSNAAGGTEKDGNGAGVRIGYAAGPFDGAVAVSRTRYAAGDVRQNNLGAHWDFGPFKLNAQITDDRNGAIDGKGHLIGASIPVGAGVARVAYSQCRSTAATGFEPRTAKVAVGYVHNLSKRTALYATYAKVRNSGGAAMPAAAGYAITAPNTSSSGADLGIRHVF